MIGRRLVGAAVCVALVITACGAREIEDAAIAVKSDVGKVHLGDEVAPILSHLHENDDVLNSTVAFLGKRLEARLSRPSNGLAKLAACDYVDEAFREKAEPSVDQTATLPNITKLAADLGITTSTVASDVKSAIGDVLAG